MTPRRAWLAAVALALGILVLVVALAASLDAPARAAAGHRRLDIPKIDAHHHVGPATIGPAMSLGAPQGIRGLVNLSGGRIGEGLEEQIAAAARFPGRVAVLASVDFDGCCGPEWVDREVAGLVQARAAGARGLKVYKNLGLTVRDEKGRRVPVDAAALDPLWDAVQLLELPVVIHSGDPRAFFEPLDDANERREELALEPRWSYADRSRYPAWRTVFDEFVRLVERRPRLLFLAPHFGNDAEDPEEVGRLLDRLPNLHVDTAARIPELGRRAEAVRRVVLAHPDRVLFGTDLQWVEGPGDHKAVILGAGRPAQSARDLRRFYEGTWRFFETRDRGIESPTPIQGSWTLEGIGLPREVLEKVYHRNAERLFGLGPAEESR